MMQADTALLRVERVTRRFGGVTAVNEVDLRVERGQIAGIIGPNGAGKTTLFNMIAGTLRPTSGRIVFRDYVVTGMPENRIVKLGIARTFQNTRLFPNLTVLENVLAGRSAHMHADPVSIILGAPWARAEETRAHEVSRQILSFIGISHLAGRVAKGLSYGDGRRVAIARALATDPQLLLLDEPAAGMNSDETEELMQLLQRIGESGVTVLLIEHDMSLVMRVCRRITVLDHGERIGEGTPAEIQQNTRVVEAYLGSGNARASRRHLRLRASTGG